MKLDFVKRQSTGKKVAKLREQGQVPVICYGGGEQSSPYSVALQPFIKLIGSHEVVIEGGGDLSGKQVIVQDVDFHPVTGLPIHADFLFVDATHAVEHEVPVIVTGEAPGVKVQGGQMVIALDKVVVRALPQHIPNQFEVSVESLDSVGSHFLVSDLQVPDNVTLVTSPDEILISIVLQSQEDEQETTDGTYMENIEVTGKGGKKDVVSEDSTDTV